MQLSFNIVDFILFAFALQGFVLAGLLFYSSKTIISNRWLGALIFIVSEATMMMELDLSGVWGSHAILQVLVLHFMLATGPVIYFYTRSLIFPSKKSTLKNWLHFAPVLLEMKYQIIYLLYTSGILSIPYLQDIYFKPSTQDMLFGHFPLVTLLSFISVTGYSVVTYVIIIRHQKSASLSINKLKDLKWIKNMLTAIFAFTCIWLFSLITNIFFPWPALRPFDHYILFFPAIALVYLLGMAAWRRQAHMTTFEIDEYIQKPAKIYFTATETDKYARQLTDLMEVQQIYLNPLLKVDDLASRMSISEKALSSLLNQHIGKSFNDFVNTYRVEEAKIQLTDPSNNNFTIAAIAADCGFNSLATFQRVFKQFTGITPSKFQNDNFLPRLSIK